MKRNIMVPAAIVAGALIIGVPTVASAAGQIGSPQILNQSIRSVDLAPNSVGRSEIMGDAVGKSEIQYQGVIGLDVKNNDLTGVDVKDGSLGAKELSAAARASLKGNTGEAGADGVVAPITKVTESKTVTTIGGSFKTNATLVDEITLPAGKYLLNAHGFFRSNQETSGNTTLQVALRSGWNGVDAFGTDYGTGFTGSAPAQAQREVTTATALTPVTLTEDTKVQVLVFGYDNAGQGSADSGKFDAQVTITAIPVQ